MEVNPGNILQTTLMQPVCTRIELPFNVVLHFPPGKLLFYSQETVGKTGHLFAYILIQNSVKMRISSLKVFIFCIEIACPLCHKKEFF